MKKLMIYSFTEAGTSLNAKLLETLGKKGYQCTGYAVSRFAKFGSVCELPENWKEELGKSWGDSAVLFIGAAGIAVRAVAPFVKDKFTDPPVVVMDEKGQFVIPLLSGHVGGAVELAYIISGCTDAEPVVTTATDVRRKFAVDVFAMKNRLVITDRANAKQISAVILEGGNVGIFSELPISDSVPKDLTLCSSKEELRQYDAGIVICQRMPEDWQICPGVLYLLPKNLYVGIGSRRGIGRELIRTELDKILKRNRFRAEQICAFGSIDLKKDEEGILALAEQLGVQFHTFSAEELKEVGEVGSSSAFVEQVTGVDNVCERAARRMCPDGLMVQEKIRLEKCTVAIVRKKAGIRFLL